MNFYMKKWLIFILILITGTTMEGKIRRPAVAGQFYAGSQKQLLADVVGCYEASKDIRALQRVQAVIVPHAGYVFSGATAASAFSCIDPSAQYEHIFLLGPSHHVWLDKASVGVGYEAYNTPLGNVKVDAELGRQIIASNSVFTYEERAHSKEHCLEVQLPLLQYRFKEMPPIVPIVIATQNWQKLEQIAEALLPYFNEKNLFVISSDFSHYPSYKDAQQVDGATGEAIKTGSVYKFVEALEKNENLGIRNLDTSACGEAAIAVLLMMTEDSKGIQIHHIRYCNSGDSQYGGHDRVVGYHAFAFTREEKGARVPTVPAFEEGKASPQPSPQGKGGGEQTTAEFQLSDADKAALKEIARESIRLSFFGRNYKPENLSPTLKQKCGAFVSLHKHGRLRGCIGHFGEDHTLGEIVAQMARAAAFEDPRFDSVRQSELEDIDIEISVLTPMRRIKSLNEFVLGKHGIYIRKGWRSGTYLPQVADEVNWSKEEFVSHCAAEKAGIGWNGWKDAELYVYEAIVF